MLNNSRLRFRLVVMIIPLVVAVIVASGTFASLESRKALVRVVNRHMAYKAEQLRDYVNSEWGILSELDLSVQEEYRIIAEESLRSYAVSLLRGKTESIIAFDGEGEVAMRIGYGDFSSEEPWSSPGAYDSLKQGWFSGVLFGEQRVGVAFDLGVFGWTVLISESEEAYFSEIQNIKQTYFWILASAIVLIIIFIAAYVGHIIRPVERLTRTVRQISGSRDLSLRARVESADEIGYLAGSFNSMISTLQESYMNLQNARDSEKEARKTAVERELETLYLLGRVSDFRDEETGEHLRRIGTISALFSRLLGQSEREQELILNSAPLHDIGKIGIPDAILLKPARLTTEEFDQIKLHTVFGYNILKDAESEYLSLGAQIALTHHEKWNGSGYPNGLAGDDIPLAGRIVALVDVFDALISSRPYKKAWSPEEAFKLILEQRGEHFDPGLVDLFEKNFSGFRAQISQTDVSLRS
ncbi:HD domain-containing phosphohydrolase [Marispirochaeta sp.]|uniref:HD domain-containing phosphohydrolase n=1 Tax=Marispirochaeta sp. TaxID=2038653 RepID=UPI0029C81C94|nr:HD domain-containing phosphohydrolase [Marispirochaeta sp.]